MKILSRIAALSAAAALAAAVPTAACAAETQAAKEEQKGSVVLSVEKFTIGQGYILEPTEVPFYDGDNGLDLVVRAVGEDNVIITAGDYGSYITGFADDGSSEAVLPDYLTDLVDREKLTGRAQEGSLCEFDYTSESGFYFFLNNVSASVGLDGYSPADGDVVRIQFTIYGYGADIGVDNSSWGGAAAVSPAVNRDEITKLLAQAKAENIDCKDELSAAADADITQEELDKAVESLKLKLSGEEVTEQPSEGTTDKPTEQPTETPTEEPTETPSEQPNETPTEEPTETPTEQPTEQPNETPSDETPVQTGAEVCGMSLILLAAASAVAAKRRKG